MENEKILNTGIELLKGIKSEDVETVQLNRTQYDDGSIGFSVEITFPAKKADSAPQE